VASGPARTDDSSSVIDVGYSSSFVQWKLSPRSIITTCQLGLESCAVVAANFISFAVKEKAAASVRPRPRRIQSDLYCRVSTPSPFNAECFRLVLFLTKTSNAGTPISRIAVPSENSPKNQGLSFTHYRHGVKGACKILPSSATPDVPVLLCS
jgi:hypothetical protein